MAEGLRTALGKRAPRRVASLADPHLRWNYEIMGDGPQARLRVHLVAVHPTVPHEVINPALEWLSSLQPLDNVRPEGHFELRGRGARGIFGSYDFPEGYQNPRDLDEGFPSLNAVGASKFRDRDLAEGRNPRYRSKDYRASEVITSYVKRVYGAKFTK